MDITRSELLLLLLLYLSEESGPITSVQILFELNLLVRSSRIRIVAIFVIVQL
jgi:hypothetical protein